MDNRNRWSRVLVIAGLAVMVLGAIDPLEGSLIILPGSVLLTVGALWGLSSVGGFGGPGGRSKWWGLVIAPFPVGWVMGIR
jgi:hypothetical protein